MEFEDVLKEVGDYGRYQKFLVAIFLIPAYIVIPWFSMDLIFLSTTPEHWCFVPEVSASNLSVAMKKELIRPHSDHFCSMYDVNYSRILESGNLTVHSNWPTKKCDNGWEYDATDYDATAATRWNLVCNDAHYGSLVLSLIFVGDVLGTPFYGYLTDSWGRKPTFLFLCAVVSISEIGSVLIPNFVVFLLLRTINGSTLSTLYGVAYLILLELVSPDVRSRMNGISTTSWTVGLCTLPVIAWLTRNWIYLSVFCSAASMALLLYWKYLPESPSWLVTQERYSEAAEIMKKISKRNGKTVHEGDYLLLQLQKLGDKMKKEKAGQESHSPMDFFKYPTLRKRFFLLTACWLGNLIPYFGLQMNVKNLAGNEFLNFFLISLVEIPSHFATWLFMERIGRRWCSVLAFLLTAFACLLPVICPPDLQVIGVVASLLGKAGSSSAFMTLYQQSPELYPTPLRGVGMGMSSTIATVGALTMPYIIYLDKFGQYIPFLIFSIISLGAAICASFLPETLNKKLPQTVQDAENFGKRDTFFSCTDDCKSDNIEARWQPNTLTLADLTPSLKHLPNAVTTKDLPDVLKKNSTSSSISSVPKV